jgi:hypothetical protein
MARSRRIGIAAAALCGGLVAFGTLAHAGAHDKTGKPPRLIEQSTCGAVRAGTAAPATTSAGVIQDIRVSVPAVALLRVDERSRVLAVSTNTGCAPRSSDEFYAIRPDGSIDAVSVKDVPGRPWTGDFTVPGRYVPQPHGTHVH